MINSRKKRGLEMALDRVRGIKDDKELYPDPSKEKRPTKYKKEFQRNSTFVITTHFLKALLSPVILALPESFQSGGLIFSIFGYLAMVALVAYNSRRLVESADYLAQREGREIRTYDEVAYVSFSTCSDRTRPLASFLKHFINALFIITYIDACSIFMIFLGRNLESIIRYYFPETFMNVHHFLFIQVIWLMLMSSIRDLKYLTPFSFVSCALLISCAVLTTALYFIPNLPHPLTRRQIGTLKTIPRFTSIISFSLSGMSIALALKSSMSNPNKFFSFPGVFCFSLMVMCMLYIPFGYLGYLQFGDKTEPSILLNIRIDNALGIFVRALGMLAVFLTCPLTFYVAFNVLWNNYLKSRINPLNVMFAEYCIRYSMISISYFLATLIPDIGTMICLKGALLHSHLEISIPAILDYVSYYPTYGNGKCGYRLLRAIFSVILGLVLSIIGTVFAIHEIVEGGIK